MIDKVNDYRQKLQWAKDNPSFCVYPYSKLDIRISNIDPSKIRVNCCCNLDAIIDVDNITADPFTELKEKLSSGTLPYECNRCKTEEETGGISERVRPILNQDLDTLEKLKASSKYKWYEISILVSNLCNLSCRSCEPFSSSTYAKITLNSEYDSLTKDITSDSRLWEIITETIESKVNEYEIIYIHFMGGETLLHNGNLKIVNWLFDKKLQHKVGIRITTSINVPIKKQLAEKLGYFYSVEFILSIDGANENYHYIRWPAKFEKVIDNLNQLVQYSKDAEKPFNFYLCPVISLNNVLYLDEYFDFWYGWQKTHNINLFFMQTNLLPRTNHLDLQALPRVYRHHIIRLFENLLEHKIIKTYQANMYQAINFINSAINELQNYDDDFVLWKKFLTHTAEFDVRTKTDFKHYNQKLYDILSDEDKKLFSDEIQQVDTSKKYNIF